MSDEERKEYRDILRICQIEFEEMYKFNRYSLKACESLSWRIAKIRAKYDKSNGAEGGLDYWQRKDIKELCTPGVARADIEAELDLIKDMCDQYEEHDNITIGLELPEVAERVSLMVLDLFCKIEYGKIKK